MCSSDLKPNDNINEWIEYIEDRNFNDYRYVLNSNILNKLGWKEETNFEIGLNKTIEWYKNNKNFFRHFVPFESSLFTQSMSVRIKYMHLFHHFMTQQKNKKNQQTIYSCTPIP